MHHTAPCLHLPRGVGYPSRFTLPVMRMLTASRSPSVPLTPPQPTNYPRQQAPTSPSGRVERLECLSPSPRWWSRLSASARNLYLGEHAHRGVGPRTDGHHYPGHVRLRCLLSLRLPDAGSSRGGGDDSLTGPHPWRGKPSHPSLPPLRTQTPLAMGLYLSHTPRPLLPCRPQHHLAHKG